MRQQYATGMNKQYLEYLGITYVSEDGKTILGKDGKELKQHNDGRYLLIQAYDPIKRQSTPKELRTNTSGSMMIGVHRVVYTWFNGFIPNGLLVDHINNDKMDNKIENLQLLTPEQNLFKNSKNKEKKVYSLPKKMELTYESCENLLNDCLIKYEEAKLNHDSKLAHKLRGYKVKYESWLKQLKQN